MSSINSVSTVPYVPQAATTAQDTATDSTKTEAAAAPALDARPPQLAAATAAALIAEQAAPPVAPADLAGQDLRNTDLTKLDLKNANLKGANLSGMDLSGLDFSGADLSGANLSGATLVKTNLTGVTAEGANFSSATLTNTAMDNADFRSADFSKASISNKATTEPPIPADFAKTNVNFDGANFAGASIKLTRLLESTARNADFSGATLSSFSFEHSDLSGATFREFKGGVNAEYSNAENVDFRSTSGLASVRMDATKLSGADFQGGSYTSLTLRFDDLRNVNLNVKNHKIAKGDFEGSDLSGKDFSGYDLQGARFGQVAGSSPEGHSWSNGLENVNFANANLIGAHFYVADVSSANFSGASLRAAWFTETNVADNKSANIAHSVLTVQHGFVDPTEDPLATIDALKAKLLSKDDQDIAEGNKALGILNGGPSDEAVAMSAALRVLTGISDRLHAERDGPAKDADAKKAEQQKQEALEAEAQRRKNEATEAKIADQLTAATD
ncbi:Uncharacterized protein YjbI, contains pentapeptide repeats [Sphingomonas sp. NFR04]|uniref:pentapeptide repeat-containing protein n=1 Tax=Sphingomonas sp. NFR04 TaxID=1566283 RepID=UPI0008EC2E09|nr:pentapeptide repeat-containing protein [Sphingomonas sp. NFR04]SFK03685.1 Uncharacterized protein YjbI, contains pentapeptide repeats [Sphingomonas sp. NFR04]